MSKLHPKRLLLTLAKWLLTGGMLAYALHEIDFTQMRVMLKNQSPLIPLAVIALIIGQMVISTFRWQRVIRVLAGGTRHPAYGKLFGLNYISVFFNSCLPGTIGGDVVRSMLLKSDEYPLTLAAHSVILDRLIAVFGLCVMVIAGLPWLAGYIPQIQPGWLMPACALLFLGGLWLLATAPKLIGRLPSTHLSRLLAHLVDSTQKTVFAWRDFSIMTVQAIAGHACFCFAIVLMAGGLHVPFGLAESLLLIPPVLLLILLPISVGGWGVREVSMVGFLALAGISKEAALAISVQFGILSIVASLPGAWYYARSRQQRVPS